MGHDKISNIWVSLLGGTTPQLLQSTLPQDAIGGGLTSRIIFVYEPRKGKTVEMPFKTPEEIVLEEKLSHDLMDIQLIRGEFSPDPTFIDRWKQWYPEQDRNPVFNDPRLEGYLTRRGVHLLKLSMIMNASRGGDMMLSNIDFSNALQEMRTVERKMPQVFRGIGKSELTDVTDRIMTIIAARGEMHMDDLIGMFYYDADRDKIHKILNTLTSMAINGKKHFSWKGGSVTSGIIVYTS